MPFFIGLACRATRAPSRFNAGKRPLRRSEPRTFDMPGALCETTSRKASINILLTLPRMRAASLEGFPRARVTGNGSP